MLKPLLFEVPGITAETPFIGRDWLFTRLEEVLRKTSSCEGRGAVIVGNAGSGKTAIMWRLVTLSCHGMPTAQGGCSIPQSPSSSPKCEHPMFTHNRLICRFVCVVFQLYSWSLQCAPANSDCCRIRKNISFWDAVCNWVTHFSFKSSPEVSLLIAVVQEDWNCFLFFPSAKVAQELIFCLKNNGKKTTDMMFSVLHSTDFYLWIEYVAPKMIKKKGGSRKHMLLLSPFNSVFPNWSKNHYQDCLVRKSSSNSKPKWYSEKKKCITA